MHVRVLCATRLFVRYMSLKARSSWSGAADPSRDSRITAAWSLSACGACTIHLAALRACREADFIGMGQHQIQPSSDCMELKIRQIRRWYMDVINWIKDGSFKELGLCNRLVPLKSYDKARNGKEVNRTRRNDALAAGTHQRAGQGWIDRCCRAPELELLQARL